MDANYLMMLEKLFNLPQGMLPAVSKAESNDNPRAVSPKGALGQYQLMPATAKEMGVNPMDPEQAAFGAAKYLSQVRDQIGSDDPQLIAAGYNAGPGAVKKYGGIPPYPETQAYAQKVSAALPQPELDPSKVKWDDTPDPAAVKWDSAPDAKTAAKAPPTDTQPDWQAPSTGLGGRALMGLGDFLRPATRAIVSGLAAGADQLAPGSDFGKQAHEAVGQIDANTASQNAKFAARQAAEGTTVPGTDLVRGAASIAPAFAVPMGAAETIGGRALLGAGQGAVMGAAGTQPGESYAKNAALGGAVGGVASGAVDALGRVIRGAKLRPDVQALVDQGVTPTPGQALGGLANSIEQKAMSTPILGEAIAGGRRAAVEDMNRALYKQVLDPIGETAPKAVGRDAVEDIGDRLATKYDALLPQMSMHVDQQMQQDMAGLVPQFGKLPEDMRNTFNSILDDNVLTQTTRTGQLNGTDLKAAMSALNQEAKNYGRSSAPNDQRMAQLLRDTQGVLRSALTRQNPVEAPKLAAIDRAYSNYAVLRDAASRVTNPENPIMPGQLQAAIKASDKSVGKGNFAKGNAKLQAQLGDPSVNVLGQAVPDSGTAGRMMLSHGLLAGIPYLMGHPGVAGAILAPAALYGSSGGRAAMFAALARRPELARILGQGIQNASPNAGAAAGFLSGSRQGSGQ